MPGLASFPCSWHRRAVWLLGGRLEGVDGRSLMRGRFSSYGVVGPSSHSATIWRELVGLNKCDFTLVRDPEVVTKHLSQSSKCRSDGTLSILLAPWVSLVWEHPCSHNLLFLKKVPPGSVPLRCTVVKSDCRALFCSRHGRPRAGLRFSCCLLLVPSSSCPAWQCRCKRHFDGPPKCSSARNHTDVLAAPCKIPTVPSKPRPWIMCSSLCLFNVSCGKRRWEDASCKAHNFEARALLTCPCELRHWISMVSSGMKSSSSPPVSTALFRQVVPELLHV